MIHAEPRTAGPPPAGPHRRGRGGRRTPPEGTPIVSERSSSRGARALAGLAGAAQQACELIR